MHRFPLYPWLPLLVSGVLTALAGPTLQPITPAEQTVSLGATVRFRVSIQAGEGPFVYQWRHGGTPLDPTLNPSAANSTLSLTNMALADAGEYTVVVTDTTGPTTSSTALLRVDPTFAKITTGAIVTDKEGSVGPSWFDYDNDNLLDLYVANGHSDGSSSKDSVYHNNGDGTFTKITNAVTAGSIISISGAVADFDEDGNLDLFRTAAETGRPELFRGDGRGGFTLVAGPMSTLSTDESFDAAWADYDGDGDLDLLVANGCTRAQNDALYRNNGEGAFTRMTAPQVGPIVSDSFQNWGCYWMDYDADGAPDALMIPRDGPYRLYHNQGDGTFTLAQAGSLTSGLRGGSCGAWGDYDNDGYPDFFDGTWALGIPILHRNLGNGTFTNVGALVGFGPGTGLRGTWGDYDNDGFLDLFVSSYQGTSAFYRNRGDGTFEAVDVGSPLDDGTLRSIPVWADYDNDGFLDLFVACGDGTPTLNLLYRNNLPAMGHTNHWLKVKLTGTASNRSAIGAKIRVKATIGGRSLWQLREVSGNSGFSGSQPLTAHFGLGDATAVEVIRIEWPSGNVQELSDIGVDLIRAFTEPIRIQPPRPSASLGATVVLKNIYPSGTYQWQFKGVDLPDQTNRNLTLNNVQAAQAGRYSVAITRADQTTWTNYAYLTVDPTFTRITEGPLVTERGSSHGTAIADFNHDGFADLLVGRGDVGRTALYRNLGNGTFTNDARLLPTQDNFGGLWGDFNNDSWPDPLLFVWDKSMVPFKFFRNEAEGGFVAIQQLANTPFWGQCGLDYNHDGLLDLYTNHQLFRNLGDGTFALTLLRDVGELVRAGGYGTVAWVDYDDDGQWEVYNADLRNRRQYIFREDRLGHYVSLTNFVTLDRTTSPLGAVWGDFDNDGRLDLFVAGWDTASALYHNVGNGQFERGAFPKTPGFCNIPTAADYDNDGFLDLFMTRTPAPNLLYRNNGDGSFSQVTVGSPATELPLGASGAPGYNGSEPCGYGGAWFDDDNDGFLDLYVVNANDTYNANVYNFLYHNNGNSNGWLKVNLQGTRSTRDGAGAKVRVKATYASKSRWQRRDVASVMPFLGDTSAHFGLGNATSATTLRVEWPSGVVQEISDVAKNQLLTIWEPPYLSAETNADGDCVLSVTAEPNHPWRIEASTDLVQWRELATLTSSTANLCYTDASSMDCRFYRVVAP